MKTAFISGGSGDIGSAVCIELAKLGYAAAIGYCSNSSRAEEVCMQIRSSGGTAMAVRCDITDTESIRSAAETVRSELGSPSALVNCAGTAKIGPLCDLSDEEVIRLTNENLIGTMLLTKALLPDMIKRHRGKIVNISSVWGECGASCEAVYSAAKAGIIGFTKALAKEVAPSGINVNCISAGLISTKMNSSLSNDELAEIIQDIPAGIAGTPDDIAAAVGFLVSERSDYINGQILRVDGLWI